MALKLETIGGYGSGALGDVGGDELFPANLNSYARVTAISGDSITIDDATAIHGSYEDFTEGAEILLHASTAADSAASQYIGAKFIATVTAVNGNILTLNKNANDFIPADEFGKYNVQAVTVAQFRNLTLPAGISIQPIGYSDSTYVGGIVALKCSGSLIFDGGHIDLQNRGIPNTTAAKALRPLTLQETNGTANTDIYSAWENAQGFEQFTLNCGDGAVFIAAKKIVFNENSRIGNTTTDGVQFQRGYYSGGVPRQGGASIILIADELENFDVKCISKRRTDTAGKGLGRCYIASNTILRNDEGLYAYDILTDPSRAMSTMNVKDFGNGNLGSVTNVATQINNYALVTAISADRKTLTYSGKTVDGIAPITRGALVMIHASHKNNPTGVEDSGKFVLAHVLSDNGTDITIDHSAPDVTFENVYMQIVSVPQYANFTLSKKYKEILGWADGVGGIFAIAVKDTCDLSGGTIDTRRLGTYKVSKNYYGAEGLATIGNNQDRDKLPIAQGNGSVFILAQNLIMNENTRIGGVWDGSVTGGIATKSNYNKKKYGGYFGESGPNTSSTQTGGSGAGGGKYSSDGSTNYTTSHEGGYGSAGCRTYGTTGYRGCQGAHIMIIADTIQNFTLKAISTGGSNRTLDGNATLSEDYVAVGGGAGYGGGGSHLRYIINNSSYYDSKDGGGAGGYNGGGSCKANYCAGGSAGWCFIYCNHAINQSIAGIRI